MLLVEKQSTSLAGQTGFKRSCSKNSYRFLRTADFNPAEGRPFAALKAQDKNGPLKSKKTSLRHFANPLAVFA